MNYKYLTLMAFGRVLVIKLDDEDRANYRKWLEEQTETRAFDDYARKYLHDKYNINLVKCDWMVTECSPIFDTKNCKFNVKQLFTE